MRKKVFNWSEVHLIEVTSYKIHILEYWIFNRDWIPKSLEYSKFLLLNLLGYKNDTVIALISYLLPLNPIQFKSGDFEFPSYWGIQSSCSVKVSMLIAKIFFLYLLAYFSGHKHQGIK